MKNVERNVYYNILNNENNVKRCQRVYTIQNYRYTLGRTHLGIILQLNG